MKKSIVLENNYCLSNSRERAFQPSMMMKCLPPASTGIPSYHGACRLENGHRYPRHHSSSVETAFPNWRLRSHIQFEQYPFGGLSAMHRQLFCPYPPERFCQPSGFPMLPNGGSAPWKLIGDSWTPHAANQQNEEGDNSRIIKGRTKINNEFHASMPQRVRTLDHNNSRLDEESPRMVSSDSRPIKLKHKSGNLRPAIGCPHASMGKYNVYKRKTKVTHPFYFTKGSLIQLASGELKQVENLETVDFFQQSRHSSMRLEVSTVEDICRKSDPDLCVMTFVVGSERNQVVFEVPLEHPFFVLDQGWSSCDPERTESVYQLKCRQLDIGDRCFSLTKHDPARIESPAAETSAAETSDAAAVSKYLQPPKRCSNAEMSSTGLWQPQLLNQAKNEDGDDAGPKSPLNDDEINVEWNDTDTDLNEPAEGMLRGC